MRIISKRVLMLRAVKLQCQFRGPTRHVENIGANNQLPGEARPIAGQLLPYHSLGIGLPVSQCPSIGSHIFWNSAHDLMLARHAPRAYPPPAPPFQGGEKLDQPSPA